MRPLGYEVSVHYEKPREFILLIPHRSPDVVAHVQGTEAAFRLFQASAPTRSQLECIILKKAFENKSYLRKLKRGPRETLDAELQVYGGSLPADVRVTLLTEKVDQCVVVLPSPSIAPSQLSDEELRAAAVAVVPIAWIVGATVGVTMTIPVGTVTTPIVAAAEGRGDLDE